MQKLNFLVLETPLLPSTLIEALIEEQDDLDTPSFAIDKQSATSFNIKMKVKCKLTLLLDEEEDEESLKVASFTVTIKRLDENIDRDTKFALIVSQSTEPT